MFYKCNLFTTGVALLYCFNVVSALMTYRLNNQNYSYPTLDPVEVLVDDYTIDGVLAIPTFDKNAKCQFLFPSPDLSAFFSSANINNSTSIIVAATQKASAENGCETVAHVGAAAVELNERLREKEGPYIVMAVYLVPPTNSSYFGALETTPYKSTRFAIPDGRPPIDMVLLPEQHLDLPKQEFEKGNAVVLTVTEEPGIWNDYLLSKPYLSYIYVLAGITILFIIRNVIFLITILDSKDYPSAERVVIFALSFLAAIIFTIQVFHKNSTIIYVVFEQSNNLLVLIAFYTLLLLWNRILLKVKKTRFLVFMKYFIIVVFTTNFINALIVVAYCISPKLNNPMVLSVLLHTTVCTYIITAVLFFSHGIIFQLKKRTYDLPDTAASAINHVTRVCAIVIVGYVMLAMPNLFFMAGLLESGPKWMIACYFINMTAYFIRISALLCILNANSNSKSMPITREVTTTMLANNETLNESRTLYTVNTRGVTSSSADDYEDDTLPHKVKNVGDAN
ncbi:hypothetical protein BDF19DRAFT_451815 [Syncephalis fuscata]|nr:hypothetical protein BDF19DRAFT_451815 [Syncephalis fuscata]